MPVCFISEERHKLLGSVAPIHVEGEQTAVLATDVTSQALPTLRPTVHRLRPHETEESAKETADPMPSLKVERSRVYRADPWSRGKTTTRLIELVLL